MSNIINNRSHKIILLLIDLCIVFSAYYLAFFIRYDSIPKRNLDSFLSLTPWILLISVFFLSIYELYSLNRKSVWDVVGCIFISVTFMSFLTMSASFIFREFALPRSVILIAYILTILLLIIWKIAFMRITKHHTTGRVLLIGNDYETENIISQIKYPLFKGTKVTHIHANTDINRIYGLIHQIDYVMVCSSLSKEKKSKIIYHSMKSGKIVYVVPSLYDLLLSKSVITSLDDTMVMAVKPFGLTWDQQVLKRGFDIATSIILLITLSPLFLFVGALIKLDSKGPVFYKQKRVGKYNKEFMIYKFRSMIDDAERLSGPVLAVKDDTRTTKVGRFIRLIRIDELPQLINVLIGDMSIVGPRPERKFFTKEFSKQHESYHYRNTVKPGITGYAQIMGKYSTNVEDKLRYDLYYIRNYSFWLDIIILLRTVAVLIDKGRSEGESEKRREKRNKKNNKNLPIGL